MNVDAYREFLELSRCLSFTQAAQNLHLTQPALSKHIAALEREFGSELFHRDRRSVELTEAGRALAPYAFAMIEAYDGAQATIAQIRERQPVRVDGVLFDSTVGAIVSLAALILGQEGLAPLSIARHEGTPVLDLLVSNQIDIAITSVEPERAAEQGLVSHPLIEVPFVAVIDHDHPLAGRTSLHMEDLANETFIHFVDEYASAAWNNIVACCKRHGFEPRTRPVLGNAATYVTVNLEGAVLIQQANLKQLKFMEASGTVSVVPVADEDAYFSIDCIVREKDSQRFERHLAAFEQARTRTVGRRVRG